MVVDKNTTIFVIETNVGCLRSPREEIVSLYEKNKHVYITPYTAMDNVRN
jgi:hypothetical protein